MTLPLVGITGAAGAGKDSLAQGFVREGYVRYSFADPIKRALDAMFGPIDWDSRVVKEQWPVPGTAGRTPRYLAQTLGTEWGRELVCHGLWLNLAKWFVCRSNAPVVIPDVRFDNEARWIHDEGGMVIRLIRPGNAGTVAHASEHGVSDRHVTHELMNNGTLEALMDAPARLLRGWERTH